MFKWFSKRNHLCRLGVLIFTLLLEVTNITFFAFNFVVFLSRLRTDKSSWSFLTSVTANVRRKKIWWGSLLIDNERVCNSFCESGSWLLTLVWNKREVFRWRTHEKIFCYLWLIFLFSSRAEWRYHSVNKSTQEHKPCLK